MSRSSLWITLAAGIALSAEAHAGKKVNVENSELREQQLLEVGVERAPPRVVVVFSMPGSKAKLGIACARKPKSEDPANCAVIDGKGKILDASVGLNVLRIKGKEGERLELLFTAQWDKQTVHVASYGPLDLAFIDGTARAFGADLSMIEYMDAEQGFPIGVALAGETKAEGTDLVFGAGGKISAATLVAELAKAPAPLPPPEPVVEAPAAENAAAEDAAPEDAPDE